MIEEPAPAFAAALRALQERRYTWLVTGVAGFIGSHLAESLLGWGQHVLGIDNFATGQRAHLELLERAASTQRVGSEPKFNFVEGDISDSDACRAAFGAAGHGVDFVLHHAALGSVPRSMKDPASTQRANVDGTLQVLLAARDAGVRRFVYASSSSVYGDDPRQPKQVGNEGRPLSPYALSKAINEQQADLFARLWDLRCVGLRYFNVFGPRQDPKGPYAAVIPRWIAAMRAGQPCTVYGDGTTSRDFCYVANVVQANVLAALTDVADCNHLVCNVAVGERTSLNELHRMIREGLAALAPAEGSAGIEPLYDSFRPGDVKHSLADIGLTRAVLGYEPTHTVSSGLAETLAWAITDLQQ